MVSDLDEHAKPLWEASGQCCLIHSSWSLSSEMKQKIPLHCFIGCFLNVWWSQIWTPQDSRESPLDTSNLEASVGSLIFCAKQQGQNFQNSHESCWIPFQTVVSRKLLDPLPDPCPDAAMLRRFSSRAARFVRVRVPRRSCEVWFIWCQGLLCSKLNSASTHVYHIYYMMFNLSSRLVFFTCWFHVVFHVVSYCF